MEIGLEDGSVLGIEGQQKRFLLRCLAGTLYLTKTGDVRDYFLGKGEQMEVAAGDSVVIEAWGEARLVCLTAEEADARCSRLAAWHLVAAP